MMIHKSHHRSLHTFVLFLGAWRHLSLLASESVKFCCIAHSSHLLHGCFFLCVSEISLIFANSPRLLLFNWTLEIIFYLAHCCYRNIFLHLIISSTEPLSSLLNYFFLSLTLSRHIHNSNNLSSGHADCSPIKLSSNVSWMTCWKLKCNANLCARCVWNFFLLYHWFNSF